MELYQIKRELIDDFMKQRIPNVVNAKKLILIGIAPHPPAYHIWDFIARNKGHIYYIGNKVKFEKWAKSIGLNNYTHISDKLKDGFLKLKHIL